jgi:hypothetical protein
MTSVVSWEHIAGAQETALKSAGLIRRIHVESWEKRPFCLTAMVTDLAVAMAGWAR